MPKKNTNIFDASQAKMHIKEYSKQIDDIVKELDDDNSLHYRDFIRSISVLQNETDAFYTPSEEGAYPLLTKEDKEKLQKSYQEVMKQSAQLINMEDNSLAAAQLRNIAREIQSLLTFDMAALEMTNVEMSPVTLPVLIANARAQAVDMGEQQTEIASGQVSSRQHIKIQDGTTIQEGYFTPTSTVHVKKDYEAHMAKMKQKYPDYVPLLNAMEAKGMDAVLSPYTEYDIYRGCKGNMDQDEIHEKMCESFSETYDILEIGQDFYQPYAQKPDYINFIDDFSNGMNPIKANYKVYREGHIVDYPEGTNIDKRNTAVARLYGLLGEKDLVPETKPMMLIQNGQPVVGTFMAAADATDLSKLERNDPVTQYTVENNLNNPSAFKSIAAMQVGDFISGGVDRHPQNFLPRFDKYPAPDAKLIGVVLIDNDLSFSHATAEEKPAKASKFVTPEEMGVISEETYNAIKAMTPETLKFALHDCEISDAELDKVWERRNALLNKIEEDRGFYENKKVGELEEGHIRIVKENEWDKYSLQNIAEKFPTSQFKAVCGIPTRVASIKNLNERTLQEKQEKEAARNIALGIVPQAHAEAPQQEKQIPVGKVIGTAAVHEADPLNVAREETIRMVVPNLTQVPTVGDAMGSRYPLSYRENGTEKKGFFTPKQFVSISDMTRKPFDNAIEKNPEYSDVLSKMKEYYNFAEGFQGAIPSYLEQLPWKEIGISNARRDQLLHDDKFNALWEDDISSKLNNTLGQYSQLTVSQGIAPGQRIETRNVMMSDLAEVFGVSHLIAKSTTAQVMSGGTVIDGIFMEKAEGVDLKHVPTGHPIAKITEEEAKKVYNNEEGLKNLADLQIIDYIENNADRHENNMLYQFKDLGTDHAKFIGPQGIDNDLSGGTHVPEFAGKINVISEEMAQKIANPDYMNAIVEKKQKNGASAEEIEAEKQRVEKLKTAVTNGSIRIVKNGEWGKNQNTIEALAANAKDSIFDVVNEKLIKPMAVRALTEKNVQMQNQPELEYAKVVKVGDFGMNAMEQKELDELTKESEKEFRAQMNNTIATAKEYDSLSTKEYLQYLKDNVKVLKNDVKSKTNTPLLHPATGVYKKLIKASENLEKLTNTLFKKYKGENPSIRAEDSRKLLNAFNEVSTLAAGYNTKKQNEINNGAALEPLGQSRKATSLRVSDMIQKLQQGYKKVMSANLAQESPVANLHDRLKAVQAVMNEKTGEKLRTLVAREIYYRGLEGSSLTLKNSEKLLDALNPDVIDEGAEQIKQSPAFQALAKMPDAQLRALAQDGDGGKLMDKFFHEAAKAKKAETERQKAQHRTAQANMHMDNPNMGMH